MASATDHDRRAHPRVPASFSVGVRRLGSSIRPAPPATVPVVDLSVGGIRVVAPEWVGVGDVVEIEVDELALRGLVVNVSRRSDGSALHAHVAFTNVSAEKLAVICQLVDRHTATPEAASGAAGAT